MDTLTGLVPAASSELTSADRCDRCGAQAFVRVTMPSGRDLLFCGHHGHEHRARLLLAGASIEDQTERLHVRRQSSAAA